ncbi:hydantoinase/oxoprolinase family protein [Veillonella criceti]|uniref:N-methylhydantoinase A/acetone carboxylase, beta subunit n=1 Tax=Veillonella criceti TaxID=103891 RepID=A0A380NN22_9FIRM|nr:hydantoinase/oxoprolinase family protein [Veillonella criceti]SUP44408.1 N-methylhydantoinase A/acetone carboxylase, beta subunit [Veillonella criceti]
MLLGLDVGGTFTDAVVIDEGHILQSHKCRTTKPDLMQGIEAALAGVAKAIEPSKVTRITLSTTMVTNALVMNQVEPVDLYIIPGPGMDIRPLLPVDPIVLSGYTDHRGSLTAPLKSTKLSELAMHKQYKRAAVSAKFAVRNPSLEQTLVKTLNEIGYESVSAGAQLSGSLNFPRRTISAYFNSAVQNTFQEFANAVEAALARYGLTAPIYILKADGGSLPLAHMQACPVETAFTGPAASVLGMAALQSMPKAMTVALDMGGTTTDISLWQAGKPLMARGGARIQSYSSAVRSFAVSSVGIGGESAVIVDDGDIQVGPHRMGPSMALGGEIPTLGDALIVLGRASYGEESRAWAGLRTLAANLKACSESSIEDDSVIRLAQDIVAKAVAVIVKGITTSVSQENKLPIYVVRDIVEPVVFKPEQLVAVGGTAESLAPFVAQALQLPLEIPTNAPVANAVGAAVAKETLMITLHLDTAKGILVVPELGIHEKNRSLHSAAEVEQMALTYLAQEGQRLGLHNANEGHIVAVEDVPIIEGWQSIHRLITVKAQLEPGVSLYVK